MSLKKIKLADGINISFLETGKFKTNFLSFNFIAPLEKKSAAMNALIPAVLLRGSEKYPTMADINKKLDFLYASSISGRNYKRGEKQIFGLCAGMLDSSYTIGGENLIAEVTDVLENILLSPVTDGEAFDGAYTESEKSNLIDTINANINNKTYYAQQRCIQEMCKNERFGLSENGTVEEVSAVTPEKLYSHYKYALSHYPIEIFFVGQCDENELASKFRSMLASIKRTPVILPPTEIIKSAEKPKTIVEDMPVNQGKLTIGMRSGITIKDSDYPALMLFNGIFGGAVTSKLFMNVREKMSLCYYCSSYPDATKGLVMIQSGIEVKNRDVAQKAIFEQLEAVKNGDFTEDEYSGALLSIVNSYNELSDSARGLETWYLGRLLDNIGGNPDDVVAMLRAVKREEIIAAANKSTVDTIYFLNGTLKGEENNG